MKTTMHIRDYVKEDTARARVLNLLLENLGQWVRASVLLAPNAGGSEGLRRLRELRDAGCEIEQDLVDPEGSERKYMLVRLPENELLKFDDEKKTDNPTPIRSEYAAFVETLDANGMTFFTDGDKKVMAWLRKKAGGKETPSVFDSFDL